MHKRHLFLSIVSSLLLIAIYPLNASAHELETDGGISAELHVEPYDHPLAGQKTTYRVAFEDEPADFNLENYDTTIAILDQGEVIATQPFTAAEPNESTDTYEFPNAKEYIIRVHGQPKQAGKHPEFTLDFPVQVKAGKATEPISPVWWVGGGLGLLGLIAAAVVIERSSKPKSGASNE